MLLECSSKECSNFSQTLECTSTECSSKREPQVNVKLRNAHVDTAQVTANVRSAQVLNAQVTAKHLNAHVQNAQENFNRDRSNAQIYAQVRESPSKTHVDSYKLLGIDILGTGYPIGSKKSSQRCCLDFFLAGSRCVDSPHDCYMQP